jgi:hypothetical protein
LTGWEATISIVPHTKETLTMRRDEFLKTLAALAATGAIPLSAHLPRPT